MNSMETAKRGITVLVAYFLIYVVWGSTYYFIGVALQGLTPFLLGALRFTSAGLLLLLWCAFHKEQLFRKELMCRSAISGIVLLFIDMAVIMLAQQYVSSSLVAIVASSTAIWIMLLDVPMWRKNFRNLRIVGGILLGFIGVGVLYIEQINMESNIQHHEYGILLLIGGCISWALGTLYTKYRSCEIENINNFSGSAWQMFVASLMFWVCALLTGEVQAINWSEVPAKAWYTLVYLITFGSILAYSAYVWLLKVRPATEVATHAYVNPVVAVIIGAGIGEEHVTLIQITGLILILLSVLLVNRSSQGM